MVITSGYSISFDDVDFYSLGGILSSDFSYRSMIFCDGIKSSSNSPGEVPTFLLRTLRGNRGALTM